jgi:transcriptional regulator with XRE-family HTH domain
MVTELERMQRFAFALQQAMTERKMSARQIALALKVDARHVRNWLRGQSLPDLYQADELVDVLQVRPELFRDPPPVPPYPINDYLLGAAETAVGNAVAKGRVRGADRARRPREDGAPSKPEPSGGRPLPSGPQ